MSADKFKIIPAAHLILIRDNKVLLLRRKNTGYEDGNYSVVAGHVEANESAKSAMSREALEEAAINIDEVDLEFALVMYRMAETERIDFFFATDKWTGKVVNKEPEKCDDLSWFALNNLPNNVIPYVREAINCYQKGIKYTEFGW